MIRVSWATMLKVVLRVGATVSVAARAREVFHNGYMYLHTIHTFERTALRVWTGKHTLTADDIITAENI